MECIFKMLFLNSSDDDNQKQKDLSVISVTAVTLLLENTQ